MQKQVYKVWNPDVETKAQAQEIETTAPTFAGEIYAEELGVLTNLPLMVEAPSGELYEVYVTCEPSPEFWGTARRVK